MARVLADFSVAAETAQTAVFYFGGHGLEVDGQNYLLPKDARLNNVRRIYFETIKLADVRAAVEHASHLRLILLDACRNDPFKVPMRGLDGRRSVAQGFANIEPRGNTGVAYAAKHGTTASDGPYGGNSPFASALIKHLPTPGLEVRLLFGQIRDEVWKATNGMQEPHFYNNFGGQELYLVPAALGKTFELAKELAAELGGGVVTALRESEKAREFNFGEAAAIAGLLMSAVQMAMQYRSDKKTSALEAYLEARLPKPDTVSPAKRSNIIRQVLEKFGVAGQNAQ